MIKTIAANQMFLNALHDSHKYLTGPEAPVTLHTCYISPNFAWFHHDGVKPEWYD
jgi:hypothetical protein